MAERMIDLTLQHPENGTVLKLRVPAGTRFDALTPLLYEHRFVLPQRIGYAYIARNHLCGARHTLADYLPDGESALTLRVFACPQVI